MNKLTDILMGTIIIAAIVVLGSFAAFIAGLAIWAIKALLS